MPSPTSGPCTLLKNKTKRKTGTQHTVLHVKVEMHVSRVSKLVKADTLNIASARVPPFLVLSDFSPHSKVRRALPSCAPSLHDLISMTLMKGRGLLEELDGLIGLLWEGKKAK